MTKFYMDSKPSLVGDAFVWQKKSWLVSYVLHVIHLNVLPCAQNTQVKFFVRFVLMESIAKF